MTGQRGNVHSWHVTNLNLQQFTEMQSSYQRGGHAVHSVFA